MIANIYFTREEYREDIYLLCKYIELIELMEKNRIITYKNNYIL